MTISSDFSRRLHMRVHQVWIPAFLALSIVGAFMAGRYVGSADTEKKLSTLGSELSSQQSVETLLILNAVSARLRESKVEDAKTLLARYAQLQVPGVMACSRSPMCMLFAGSHMPSAADLKRIGSPGDPVPGDR